MIRIFCRSLADISQSRRRDVSKLPLNLGVYEVMFTQSFFLQLIRTNTNCFRFFFLCNFFYANLYGNRNASNKTQSRNSPYKIYSPLYLNFFKTFFPYICFGPVLAGTTFIKNSRQQVLRKFKFLSPTCASTPSLIQENSSISRWKT